jgi:hypothetical protein
VVWIKVFDKYRRAVLSGSMIGVKGRIQREGEVVHLVAQKIWDLTDMLRSVGNGILTSPSIMSAAMWSPTGVSSPICGKFHPKPVISLS